MGSRFLAACAFMSALVLPLASAFPDEAPARHWSFGGYELTLERTTGGQPFEEDLLTLRRAGRLLHADVAAQISFVVPGDAMAGAPRLVAVTGKPAQDIVLQSFAGGAHCCFTIEILTLGETFEVSPPFETQDAGAALVELPGSGLYGLKSSDESFNYRFGSFVDSPHPEIILRYDRDDGFRLDTGLMRQPKMTAEALRAAALKVRDDKDSWQLPEGFLPGSYQAPILRLIYGGDMEGARRFATEAWPPGKAGLKQFLADLFDCALPESPWWPAVASLNGVKAYERGPDCKAWP
jgi:hypothetical protein